MNILKILIDDEFISINDDEKTSHQFSEYFSIRLGKEELSYEDKNKYGKNIFDTIFSTAQRQQLITDCLNSLTDRENLYLKIISDDEEIHNIPFELININGLEGGYLLKKGNVHICRSILLDDKPVEKIKLPVRILVLISLPLEVYQQAPLDPLKELKNLYDALGDYIDRGLVEIEVEEKVNIPVLKERLLGKQYDIIHFTGHGSEGGYLIIEDEENTDYAKLIDAKSLAEMFAGAGVKLFFFNACQSARGSKITPSVSYHLFKSLPNAYVLANIASVNDREASETTKFIYKTFFENGSVGNVLYKSRLELADDWWKPVFFGAPEIILDSDIKAELKKPAERRIIKRPADVIENYVYRYGIVRKTSDLITKKKYLVLHGIAGAGKSTFAVYISKFFDATFRHHLIFDLKEENLNTPLKLITELLIQVRTANIIDTESFNKLNKEIASDSSKPNVQSKTEEILKLLDRKKLLILDNLENIAQDRSGIINEEWKWFIELLLNHEDVFPVFASRIKLYLTKRKPLENILEIGEYTDAEVGFFWGNLDDTDRNYFEKQYPYIKTVAGNHPLFISKAVEKKFADVGKVLALREFKDYLEFYREYFDEYRGDVEKLFLLDLSFSSEFAENIFSIDFYDQIKNGLLIFNFVEGPEINSFYRIILSYFAGDFIITPEKEILFCNELLKYYKEKIEYKIDVLNILNILINYYKRYNEKAYEEPIVDILNTINFSEYPEFTFFIVEQVSKIISKFSIAEEKLTKSYNNLGLAYNNKGDYEKAIEYYQKALEIEESKLGRDHPDTALSYINLGTAYSNEGDYGKAIENYQKALEITESKLGKDHPDTAASYNNLGTAYLYKGDYNKAIEYHKKALEIRESRLGRDHPDTATTYNDLGRTYSYKGDYDKAIRYYQKALEITESKLGKDHPDTAISYSNLGAAYNEKGDYDKAIKYYQKDLEIKESRLGKDHPDTAICYNNLGTTYNDKGDYDKSIKYYQKALEIKESRLGKNHPSTAASYTNLGSAYNDKGDYDKAIKYFKKSLEITEFILGKDHPSTAANYNNLGSVYNYKRDYDKAIEYYQKALEITESRLGKDHPYTATGYNNLGLAYMYKGDYDKAIRYYQKALEITESKLGKDHPDTAISYSNLGVAYNGKRDFEKAIEYYQKALEIAEPILGQDHPQTATSYNNLGLAYHNKGNYDKAIVYYYKSLEIRESRLGKDHPDTAKSFNNLGLVYMYKEDYDKAVEYLLKYLDSLRIRLNMVRDINIVSDIIWGEVYLIDCTVKGNLIGQEYFNAVLLEFLHFREQLLTQGFTKYYDEIKNYFIKKKTFNTDSIIKIEAVLQNTKDKMQFKEFIIELNK